MLATLLKAPVLGILRAIPHEAVQPLVEVSVRSGMRVLELAMNTAAAESKLARICEAAGERLWVGAGTVTDLRTLDRALSMGARFIVMPGLFGDVVAECVRRGVPVLPGAFTPSEVFLAHRAGAALVKVFPARTLGPGFFRELQGPMPQVPLLATGGVDESNVKDWLGAGAAAVAVGAGTYRPEWIADGRWSLIEERLSTLITAAKNAARRQIHDFAQSQSCAHGRQPGT